METNTSLKKLFSAVPAGVLHTKVNEVIGPIIRAAVFPAAIGDLVHIESRGDGPPVWAQVVAFTESATVMSSFVGRTDILPGARVTHAGTAPTLALNPNLLGCAVDTLGRTLIRFAEPEENAKRIPSEPGALFQQAPAPFERKPISKTLSTGIRSIDGFLSLGKGQRVCIIAEPGVGKSSLMATIARNTDADINVLALIGERGREVQDFIEDALTEEAKKRTVIVVSTSDESSLSRATAPLTAQRIAEYFRDNGRDVLLQVDSLTRYLRALREIGLAAGELPVRRGYPPSVFLRLPELIERAGATEAGSITALYTVLSSSSVDEDPMLEEIKGLTDGHFLLSKALADAGHYPAIDVLASLSRLQRKLLKPDTLAPIQGLRAQLAKYYAEKDFLALGAKPSDELAMALAYSEALLNYLKQPSEVSSSLEETLNSLLELWNSGLN